MDRRRFLKISGGASVAVLAGAQIGLPSVRRTLPFDVNWRFHLGDFEGAREPTFDHSAWRVVDLPHDWSIENAFSPENPSGGSGGFATCGIGWYRKAFRIADADRGRLFRIEFDGVYENCAVWLNGNLVGVHRYGYSSFAYDLTPHLRFGGENLLAVRVDNSRQPNCRWYSGSGIYRHVRLVSTDPLRVGYSGTYVTTPDVGSGSATVRVRTTVENGHDATVECALRTQISDPSLGTTGTEDTASIPAGASHVFDQELKVANIQLWSPERPAVYKVHSQVLNNRALVDDYDTSFGIRTAEFDKDRGFLLNGEPVKMKGVCLHHDCGCLGAAVPIRAWERRFALLKSLGCNAIRTSHNPPAPEFLDLCDRMGFLVIDEVFDKWDNSPRWSPIEFQERWRDELRAFLARDRNHPSVVLWSVGNETGEPGDEAMLERLSKLIGFAREQEPSRPATTAFIAVLEDVSEEEKLRRLVRSTREVDVLCLNYQEQWFEAVREAYPEIAMISAEAFAYYRGGRAELKEYHEQNPWYDVVKHDYVAGQFLWPGIDYLGESMGWPSKGWPTGLVDTAGFLKPLAGFHRAVWNPEPSVKIAVQHDGIDRDNGPRHWHWPKLAAHWNWEHLGRTNLRLHVFTNCETVELKVNGKSVGTRRTADVANNTIEWHAAYETGRVEAIGRNGDRVVARDALVTAGKPVRIELLPDRNQLAADGQDLCHIEARLIDEKGVLVPNADRRIAFQVGGAGRLAGSDNGDMRTQEPYKAPYRTTRGGRCLAIVQSLRSPGRVMFVARAEGLPEARDEITVG